MTKDNTNMGYYYSPKLKGKALNMIGAKPRLFQMVRNKDGKELSGTGKVIDGVMFASGKVVIEWQTSKRSMGIYDNLEHFLALHSKPQYEAENEFTWLDGYKPAEDVAEALDAIAEYVISFDEMKQKHKGAVVGMCKAIKRKYEEI